MITLNDYLYNGDTVVKILHLYSRDLKESAKMENNGVDLAHSNCLIQMIELLEHNEFLTLQSQTIREFYKYMTEKYPFLAFTFKGRIKSLIRLEEKINGNIVEFIYDYYTRTGKYPSEEEIKDQIRRIKDLIAYRIVISLPKCHLGPGEDREEIEKGYIYEIGPANHLGYEKRQENDRARRESIPVGENKFFDNAFERGMLLQKLDLSKVDVNMFGAENNALINDGCGLYRGRLILPYEHLSRFQNDLV